MNMVQRWRWSVLISPPVVLAPASPCPAWRCCGWRVAAWPSSERSYDNAAITSQIEFAAGLDFSERDGCSEPASDKPSLPVMKASKAF